MNDRPRDSKPNSPRIGMLATVRNRRALVTSVEPFDGATEGRLHLVSLEYTDGGGHREDSVIWEREIDRSLLEPTALPKVDTEPPMVGQEFDSLQRAVRWTAISPFLLPDGSVASQTIASPLFGAVQVEDFQLVPLLKALQMPRVSLLLADDVGLGKTIEAGLILTELLLRRRIRKVLIISPAALRKQWQQEMKSKFSLSFDIVDRSETNALQKRMGLDVNPWRTFSRIVTSYHYLRQPDVLEQFRAACSQPDGSARLPWDLLIVDEAHNLMPSNFGQDSELAEMLRSLSLLFEHKLFLSATPHNGHTRCFSGLLEQLDPVRFTQTSDFTPAMQQRTSEVLIRRLKREINEQDKQSGKTPRFGDRKLHPIPLFFGNRERNLAIAFDAFRTAVKRLIAASHRHEQLAGNFAVDVLNKRLLSCPYTFANSWRRFKDGIKEALIADYMEVKAAEKAIAADIDDDRETEGRLQHAARTVGAWLKPLIPHLETEIAAIDLALERLGLLGNEGAFPSEDARWNRLQEMVIGEYLRDGTKWRNGERLVIFTEYKTTLDYLQERLTKSFPEEGLVRLLFGGMDDREREEIKLAFNDPDNVVRILVATDAASEGLNLQETARLIAHYDIPWNPSRLDQRNGRLDRHGQANDVVVFHFTSEDNADLKFLGHVIQKVNTIREELGSMGDVFDAAFQRRFADLEDTDRAIADLDMAVESQRGRIALPITAKQSGEELAALAQLRAELDFSPETLRDTLEIALGINGAGLPRLEPTDDLGRSRLKYPIPSQWENLVNDSLRLESSHGTLGALPAIVFDPNHFVQYRNDRPVFRAAKDTALLHLGHPMYHHALAQFARSRFPNQTNESKTTSRWLLRSGDMPIINGQSADALLLITVEEMAINELRETFHHWVRTIRIPIIDGELGEVLPHVPAASDRAKVIDIAANLARVRELWSDVDQDVKKLLNKLSQDFTARVIESLKERKQSAIATEKERFKDRLAEVKKAASETTLQKLQKERDRLLQNMSQLSLFAEEARQQTEKLRDLEDELARRRRHYEDLEQFLQQERDRTINLLLPKRYTLHGSVLIFPVTVEIRLPVGDNS